MNFESADKMLRYDQSNTVDPLYNGYLAFGYRRKWPLRRGGWYGEVHLKWLESTLQIPWVPEDIFFLSIPMVRGQAAPTERESNRKHGLFHIRNFENRPLEPGYAPNGSHQFSWQFLTFLSVAKKSGHYRKVISTVGAQFSGRYHSQEVAVVERLKQEPIYELSPERKERNHYFPKRLVHCFCHKWKIFIPCVFC